MLSPRRLFFSVSVALISLLNVLDFALEAGVLFGISLQKAKVKEESSGIGKW